MFTGIAQHGGEGDDEGASSSTLEMVATNESSGSISMMIGTPLAANPQISSGGDEVIGTTPLAPAPVADPLISTANIGGGAGAGGNEESERKGQAQHHQWWGKKYYQYYYDRDAFILSIRVSIALTLATLFVVCFPVSDPFPEAVWILRTIGVVTWMPDPDIGSACKRGFERSLGTVIGAAAGLGVGFLSLLLGAGTQRQAALIGVLTPVLSFLFAYCCSRTGCHRTYTAILVGVTFGIVAYSFYEQDDEAPWFISVWRTVNILIGSILGWVVAVVVWPVSTRTLVETKVQGQIRAAGKTAHAVLDNSQQAFEGIRTPPAYGDMIRYQDPVHDAAYVSYIKSMEKWRDCKALFSMLQFDPFHRRLSEEERGQYQQHMEIRLFKYFRLQIIVMVMDVLVHVIGYGRCDDADFEEPLEVLNNVGRRIELVLDLANDLEQRKDAALTLLESDLACVRRHVTDMRNKVSLNNSRLLWLPAFGEDMPLLSLEMEQQQVLFFQLLEFLIERVVNLHYYCGLAYTGKIMIPDEPSIHESDGNNLVAGDDGESQNDDNEPIGAAAAADADAESETVQMNHPFQSPATGKRDETLSDCKTDLITVKRLHAEPVEEIAANAAHERDSECEQKQATTFFSQWTRPWMSVFSTYDHASFIFASRFAMSAAISSLLVLLFPASDPFPESIFAIVSAMIVSWLPAVDTATAVRAAWQRTVATAIGAAIALPLGFLSLLPGPGSVGQAVMLGLFVASVGFLLTYTSNRMGYRSSSAATRVVTTFGLVVVGFFTNDADPWVPGVYRTINTLIGSFLVVPVVLILWPTSARRLLSTKIEKQMRDVGKSAHLVLESSYETLASIRKPPAFKDILRHDEPATDEAYASYVTCMENWKACRALFPMLKFDPWNYTSSAEERGVFQDVMATRLARTFRIQIIVTLLDMIVRTRVLYHDCEEPLEVLNGIGQRVKQVLDLSLDLEKRTNACRELLEKDLNRVRSHSVRARDQLTRSSARLWIPPFHEGVPVAEASLENQEQVVLFFQLLELLIVITIRVHYYCLLHD